jgi:hypothetical protein
MIEFEHEILLPVLFQEMKYMARRLPNAIGANSL